MRKIAVILLLLLPACAIHQIETSKVAYLKAQAAENSGHDADAILYWKKVRDLASREIQAGHYADTNHFLRASAYLQLGEWDLAFEDLKQVHPNVLSDQEAWIYPDYCVLVGDFYSHQNMTSVAENFYQAVLKKSTWKSSPVYLLALERHVNNSVKAIETEAAHRQNAEKFRITEYEDLQKDVQKYLEDSPFNSVPHYLLGDLLLKEGRAEDALQHFLAALDFGLPTADLKSSAEFELADLLTQHEISSEMKSTLLKKAANWWTNPESDSIFRTGENTLQWLVDQKVELPEPVKDDANSSVRYLAVNDHGTLRILIWEKL